MEKNKSELKKYLKERNLEEKVNKFSDIVSFYARKHITNFSNIDEGIEDVRYNLEEKDIIEVDYSFLDKHRQELEKEIKKYSFLKDFKTVFKNYLLTSKSYINNILNFYEKISNVFKKTYKFLIFKSEESKLNVYLKKIWNKVINSFPIKITNKTFTFISRLWSNSIEYMATSIFVDTYRTVTNFLSSQLSELLGPFWTYATSLWDITKTIGSGIKDLFTFSKEDIFVENKIFYDRSSIFNEINKNLNNAVGTSFGFSSNETQYNKIKENDETSDDVENVTENIKTEHNKDVKRSLRIVDRVKRTLLQSFQKFFFMFRLAMFLTNKKLLIPIAVIGGTLLAKYSFSKLLDKLPDNNMFSLFKENSWDNSELGKSLGENNFISRSLNVISKCFDILSFSLFKSNITASLFEKSSNIFNYAGTIWDNIVNFVKDPFGNIKMFISNIFNGLVDKVKNFDMTTFIKSIFERQNIGRYNIEEDNKIEKTDQKIDKSKQKKDIKPFISRQSEQTRQTGSSSGLIKNSGKLNNINENFVKRLEGAVNEYGKPITINSGYRSTAYQAELREKYPHKAAKPGLSMHEFGFAIDANSKELLEMNQMGILQKYGLHLPLLNAKFKEPWHIEPMGLDKGKIRQGGNFALNNDTQKTSVKNTEIKNINDTKNLNKITEEEGDIVKLKKEKEMKKNENMAMNIPIPENTNVNSNNISVNSNKKDVSKDTKINTFSGGYSILYNNSL